MRALEAISAENLNILYAWACATSSRGQLCATAVVEWREPSGHPPNEQYLERVIRQSVGDALSTSSLYSGQMPLLDAVKVVPLKVLQSIHSLSTKKKQIELELAGTTIDLAPHGEENWIRFLEKELGISNTSSILLTYDTEEHYMIIAPLEPAKYVDIDATYEIESANGNFKGYLENVVAAVSKGEPRLNIYYASSILCSKTPKQGPPVDIESLEVRSPRERDKIRIVGRVEGMPVSSDDDDAGAMFCKAIDTRMRTSPPRTAGDKFSFVMGPDAKPLSATSVLVFLSTNAKDSTVDTRYALAVAKMLVELGVTPTFLDLAAGRPLSDQLRNIMNACPMLVSCYLREPDNKLGVAQQSNRRATYAPSPWVTYEEAYMIGKDRSVFRMAHHEVFDPPFWHGPSFKFTEETFTSDLMKLKRQIRKELNSRDFRESAATCMADAQSSVWRHVEQFDMVDWLEMQLHLATQKQVTAQAVVVETLDDATRDAVSEKSGKGESK